MEKIIIYGAGTVGKDLICNIVDKGKANILAVAESVKTKEKFYGYRVIEAKDIKEYDYDMIVVASSAFEEIESKLIECSIGLEKCIFTADTRNYYFTARELVSQFMSIIMETELNGRYEVTIGEESSLSYEVVETDEGCIFIGDRKDGIMEEMAISKKVYPHQEIDAFFSLTDKFYGQKPEGIFLDCGCNIASTSIYVLRKFEMINVIAFEPVKRTYNQARANAIINEVDDRLLVENIGLSDKEELVCMKIPPRNTGGGYIDKESIANSDAVGREAVRCMTLDGYFSKKGLSSEDVGYIWIDVEGFEGYVIKGGLNTLQQRKIPLYLEFNKAFLHRAGSYELLLCYLNELYDKYIVVHRGGSFDIDEVKNIDELKDEINLDCNIFCF